jgi:hypothetical protein
VADDVLKMELKRTGASARKDANWLTLTRELDPGALGSDSSGLRIVVGADQQLSWWLQIALTTDRGTFTQVLVPYAYGPAFQDRLLPYDRFKGPAGTRLDPSAVSRLVITGSAINATAFLERIESYRLAERSGIALQIRTNKPSVNVFERGESVSLAVSASGLPARAASFDVVVTDYWGQVVSSQRCVLSASSSEAQIDLGVVAPGFYEIRAYSLDANGGQQGASLVRETGSMPPGMTTFAVMPATRAENRSRMSQASYFGLHGATHDLHEYMACPWRLWGGKWGFTERRGRPERDAAGLSAAGREALSAPPRPEWECAVFNIVDHSVPDWARSEGSGAPGWKDWDDYTSYLRERVKTYMHLYPHLKPRLYEVSWEIDLAMAPVFLRPVRWEVSDVVDLYRRAAAVIRSEDPDALILGPNPSGGVHRIAWIRELFAAGLADVIDAISLHPYHGEPPPERYNLPQKIAALKALCRNAFGREVPICGLEQGYKSIRGSRHLYRETGMYLLRANLIFQGEGLRLNLPFYGYDYATEPYGYGICFNLDPKLKWGPKRIAPKAHVPALAVQADLLTGAVPAGNLRMFGDAVWGYAFEKGSDVVLVLWTVEKRQELTLPVGNVGAVALHDMMGGIRSQPVQEDAVRLSIGPAPVYVTGAEPSLYLGAAGEPVVLHAGESRVLEFPGEVQDIEPLPPLRAARVGAGSSWRLSLPETALSGAVPARVRTADDVQTQWVAVRGAVEVVGVVPVVVAGAPCARVSLRNWSRGESAVEVGLSAGDPVRSVLGPGASASVIVPSGRREADAAEPVRGILQVATADGQTLETPVVLSFLSAQRPGAQAGGMPNRATIRARGADGEEDTAELEFTWTDEALTVNVTVHDNVFHQDASLPNIWRQDSIQVAFDPEPDRETAYNPLVGQIGRQHTELTVGLTSRGVRVFRFITPDPDRLPTGDVTMAFQPGITIKRQGKATVYRCSLPWRQLGLVQPPEPGRSVGIAVLVNDSDGAGTRRAGLEFYGGIMEGKDPTEYGRMRLE